MGRGLGIGMTRGEARPFGDRADAQRAGAPREAAR
jgi:hypothetical protein